MPWFSSRRSMLNENEKMYEPLFIEYVGFEEVLEVFEKL
jgi:hypothetical protein